MTKTLAVGDAKRWFSDVLARVVYTRERFLIVRRGKPVAAVVSVEDLRKLDQEPAAPRGLLAAVGALAGIDEWDEIVTSIYQKRDEAQDRSVSLGS
jgi:prevent-host-death family protein